MNSGQRLGGVGASDHDDKLPQGLQSATAQPACLRSHLGLASGEGIQHASCRYPSRLPFASTMELHSRPHQLHLRVPLAIEWRRRRV